jgi:hypothetical protein
MKEIIKLVKTYWLTTGLAAPLAENSTAPWSHHSILRSDETWLPEWSGNLGGVQRWRSSIAWGVLGQASLSAYGVKPVG